MGFCEPKRPRYSYWQFVDGAFTPDGAPGRAVDGIKADTPEDPAASKRLYLVSPRKVGDATEIVRGEVRAGDYLVLMDDQIMHYREDDFARRFDLIPE